MKNGYDTHMVKVFIALHYETLDNYIKAHNLNKKLREYRLRKPELCYTEQIKDYEIIEKEDKPLYDCETDFSYFQHFKAKEFVERYYGSYSFFCAAHKQTLSGMAMTTLTDIMYNKRQSPRLAIVAWIIQNENMDYYPYDKPMATNRPYYKPSIYSIPEYIRTREWNNTTSQLNTSEDIPFWVIRNLTYYNNCLLPSKMPDGWQETLAKEHGIKTKIVFRKYSAVIEVVK